MGRNDAIQRVLAVELERDLWNCRPHGYPVWTIQRLLWYQHALLGGETHRAAGARPSWRLRAQQFGRSWATSLADLTRRTVTPFDGRDIWVPVEGL